ncbi:Crp/Fnr family transcriptional regulator [Mariprofundus ferrooxydans]|uniref:Transcriptional Regulator, Crp/Fnr family protein n=1 Tax=Mariprofundus ferrooxydans PV-1 TaxID=314345 RepID=Q0F1H3_9PROT|nr:Crp/Fnr family transcriptional regulator [Mariprofundus ferrooxydans]EAU55218.1 Transcriptional Regulator, Crp/Fnr family protein [Mariprofundus ferrooxydans PV-1]KON47598.1 Crp/Fnr family transcriptional regulator [Mariprofundus ferrooxydans]
MTADAMLLAFPSLAGLPATILREFSGLKQMRVDKGTVLFRDGDSCQGYVFVMHGSIRVQKMDPEGREIVLYRVEDGQTCMLTTSCLLAGRSYPAEGVVEEPTELVLLPAARFDALLADPAFRRFALGMISDRIAELMALIEDVAFGRMDVRLARRLLELDDGTHSLQLTHHQLATELGTAREVISRILKDFERRGSVALKRGRVEISDLNGLRELATQQV